MFRLSHGGGGGRRVLRAARALALMPAFASRHPIKKWAALAALLAAAVYLLLSGAEVATQRSFIMTAIVLIGVMVDRAGADAAHARGRGLRRAAARAAGGGASELPDVVCGDAGAGRRLRARAAAGCSRAPTRRSARASRCGAAARSPALILASLVAGLATTPYAAYHFHRLAPYGVLANLLAMPIVSVWVMPAGLLALLAMPFGFDGLLWRLMGEGIDWMIAVALWVASLPGAVGRMAAFGIGPLLLGTAGLVVLCLLQDAAALERRGADRAGARAVAIRAPLPDVLVAADGQAVAVRGADGTARRSTAAAATPSRARMARGRRRRAAADRYGAARGLRLRRGRLHRAACRRHARGAGARGRSLRGGLPPRRAGRHRARGAAACAALVDRPQVSRAQGAIALTRTARACDDGGAPAGYDRPWARAARCRTRRRRVSARPQPRDATPRRGGSRAGD